MRRMTTTLSRSKANTSRASCPNSWWILVRTVRGHKHRESPQAGLPALTPQLLQSGASAGVRALREVFPPPVVLSPQAVDQLTDV